MIVNEQSLKLDIHINKLSIFCVNTQYNPQVKYALVETQQISYR